MPKPHKVRMVSELVEELRKASGWVLVNYTGMSAEDMGSLRMAMREVEGNTAHFEGFK